MSRYLYLEITLVYFRVYFFVKKSRDDLVEDVFENAFPKGASMKKIGVASPNAKVAEISRPKT